jgi:hypothetical protein
VPVIEVIITPTGETIIQPRGFSGPTCQQATQALEQALGVVAQRQPTAEAYQSTDVAQELRA